MTDMKVLANLSNNLQNLKFNYKSQESKSDNKTDFKSYLSKESKENSSEVKVQKLDNSIMEKSDLESNSLNKELISEVSDKIENLLNNEELNDETLEGELQEILSLLLNFIEANFENTNIKSSETLEYDKASILTEIENVSFQENFINKLFNDDESFTLSLESKGSIKNIKNSLNNISDILNDYINNISNISTDMTIANDSINAIEVDFLEELKNLISIVPDKVIKEVENKLDSNSDNSIVKEILKGLISETNNKDGNIEIDDNNLLVQDNNKINEDEVNINLNEDFKEDNLSDNKKSENNINQKEEEILSKILEDDSIQSFPRTLNYYDKLNKINTLSEVVKEPITINKDNLNLDLIKNVRYMVKNSVEELQVKVYPKELGEMTIKLISEEGIMKAEIKATSKETYNLLNNNLNEIKKTLENQNIRIQEVNIGIYNEDTTFFSGKENSKEEFENKEVGKVGSTTLEEEEIIEELINESNVNILA